MVSDGAIAKHRPIKRLAIERYQHTVAADPGPEGFEDSAFFGIVPRKQQFDAQSAIDLPQQTDQEDGGSGKATGFQVEQQRAVRQTRGKGPQFDLLYDVLRGMLVLPVCDGLPWSASPKPIDREPNLIVLARSILNRLPRLEPIGRRVGNLQFIRSRRLVLRSATRAARPVRNLRRHGRARAECFEALANCFA
jgi:hypothetical protein